MKRLLFFALLIMLYIGTLVPLSLHLSERPVAIKLGYMPGATALRLIAADHRPLIAELGILKVIFYFGSLVEQWSNKIVIPPEFGEMYRMIDTSLQLDPYNFDGYYFAQAAFTWEVGHPQDVNRLLLRGMQYRTDDWYLPFFAGFNSAYFLKDYEAAAPLFQRAAELSGNPLLANLSARYFYEAGREDLGVLFLDAMLKRASSEQEKQAYQMRKDALLAVNTIAEALDAYAEANNRRPETLSSLVDEGFLARLPQDPYGGVFFIDPQGRVRSTSKFANLVESNGEAPQENKKQDQTNP